MKLYILTNSNKIDRIITCGASPADAYLTIYYKEKSPVTKEIAIVVTIKNLVKNGDIDTRLATALLNDFPHLLTNTSFQFSNSPTETPFTMEYTQALKPKQEVRSNRFLTDSKKIPWDKRYQARPELPKKDKETADLERGIKLSNDHQRKILQQKFSISTQEALLKKTKADYVKQDINPFVINEVSNNTNNSSYTYNIPENGEVVAKKHSISNYVCISEPLEKGSLLTISCIGIDEVSLIISSKTEQNILDCDNLCQLARILQNVPDGEEIADKMMKAYEQEQRDINKGYEELQDYNEDDADAELWDEFSDDDDQDDFTEKSGFSL